MSLDWAAILTLASGLPLASYWGVGVARLRRGARLERELHAAPPDASLGVRVRVVVAAHDERARLDAMARSLGSQTHASIDLVVALDRCADDSRAALDSLVASDPRWRIVDVPTCPAGWTGKCHAIHAALDAHPARDADFLLFSDADVRLEASCVARAVALARARSLDLLSLVPRLGPTSPSIASFVLAAGMELLHQFPYHRVNRPRRPRAFANGQFLLVRRDAYERLGGHAAVASELLEDIALARLARDHALRLAAYPAGSLLVADPPESLDAARAAWTRILGEACARRVPRLRRAAWRVRVMGTLLPLATAAFLALSLASIALDVATRSRVGGSTLLAPVAGALALAPLASVVGAAARAHSGGLREAMRMPIASWLVAGTLRRAARDLRRGAPTRWGGIEFTRHARS